MAIIIDGKRKKTMKIMRICNATNGLAFPPWDGISMFLSTHGHNYQMGYFRIDAMPWSAVVHLLRGGKILMVDAMSNSKGLPDAIRFGVTTWALVFNRAVRHKNITVAPWETKEMRDAAHYNVHKKLVQRIRRLVCVFGHNGPIEMNKQIQLEIHHHFKLDDKPEEITQDFNWIYPM